MIEDLAQNIINAVRDEYDGSDEWQTDITAPNIEIEDGMRDAIDNEIDGMDFTVYDEDAREVVASGIEDGTIGSELIEECVREGSRGPALMCYLATEAVRAKCYEIADCEPEE